MFSKKSILFIAVSLFVGACNSNFLKYSPTYSFRTKPVRCALFFPESISINYQGSVEDEFGKGDTKELITNYFKKQIREDIARQTTCREIVYKSYPIECKIQAARYQTRHGVKTFQVPLDNQTVSWQDTSADILLLLDDIKISSWLKFEMFPETGIPVYMGGSGFYDPDGSLMPVFSSSKDLVIATNYILWDNTTGELISLGYIKVVDRNRFAVSIEDWEEVMSELVATIFKRMPRNKTVVKPVNNDPFPFP